jgi:hypothetical protein
MVFDYSASLVLNQINPKPVVIHYFIQTYRPNVLVFTSCLTLIDSDTPTHCFTFPEICTSLMHGSSLHHMDWTQQPLHLVCYI